MGLITKGGINIIDKEAYVHPLELEDLEFLIKMIANTSHKGSDIGMVIKVTEKLKKEYDELVRIYTKES
jgi:hypothetical protein|tara:strand:- start:369 stop:575 length:207 start_codon:yes stop_codon:yes gene_type:complete